MSRSAFKITPGWLTILPSPIHKVKTKLSSSPTGPLSQLYHVATLSNQPLSLEGTPLAWKTDSWGTEEKSLCVCVCVCVCMLSCVGLFCNPMDCCPPGSSILGNIQARIMEWVAISFSRGSSQPRDQIYVLCISRQILYLWAIWEAHSNTRMSRIQSTDLTERWRGREAAETLVCCCKNAKWCSHYGRIWQFLIKANIDLPYNSAATPLSIYPNQGKTYVHIKTCSAMLLAGFCFLQYS